MMKVQPQYLSLGRLVNGRLFQIPEYQRAYSWTVKQREDLFKDITKVHEKGGDTGHFMATLVCLRRATEELGTDEYQRLDVVDGQQRITTLTILLKAIALTAERAGQELKIAKEINVLLVKPDSNDLFLLQTNHDSSHYYSNYIRKGSAYHIDQAETIADRELLSAMNECLHFAVNWQEKYGGLSSLLSLMKNRLFFLFHEIEDERAVYSVFEVLNSRGLDVSWLDRLKSIMMGIAFDLPNKSSSSKLVAELHSVWRDIYACIGLRQGMSTEALRFAATLKDHHPPSRPLNESDSVDLFRSLSVDAQSLRENAQWLLSVTRAYDRVIADKPLDAVTGIAQARLLATAVFLREDLNDSGREEIKDAWERVTFRIYGLLGNDARTRVGDYTRLAWRVINNKLSVVEIIRGLREIGAGFPIEKAVSAVQNSNCYEQWEHELRYLFFRYEQHLSEKAGNKYSSQEWNKIWLVKPSDSIEHIWAQSVVPAAFCHRLGNLMLLPPSLNSKLQASPAREKAVHYRNTGMLLAQEVAGLIETKGWDEAIIEERETRLLDWIRERWS